MLEKSPGIVLHSLKYSDDKQVIHILTPSHGCVAFLVRLSAAKKAKFRAAIFQPLACVDIEWYVRSREGLSTLKTATPRPYLSLPYDMTKRCVALFLAEFLHHALRHEPPSEQIFKFIANSLAWYDLAEDNIANFHLIFLLQFSQLLGIFPNLDAYTEGASFDLRSGTYTTAPLSTSETILPTEAAFLPKLLRLNYATMRYLQLSGRQRSQLLHAICAYYELHLPGFPKLKTLEVLGEMFS